MIGVAGGSGVIFKSARRMALFLRHPDQQPVQTGDPRAGPLDTCLAQNDEAVLGLRELVNVGVVPRLHRHRERLTSGQLRPGAMLGH